MGEVEEQEAVMAERAREVQAVPAGLEPERGQEREVLLKVEEQREMVEVAISLKDNYIMEQEIQMWIL